MNRHLKSLFYILVIVGAFIFVQDKYKIFEIKQKEEKQREIITEEEDDGLEQDNYVEISISDGATIKVDVEVADSDIKRIQGLSYRQYLGDYNGMLFIFDEKTVSPMWMKDMLIELDMLFIDEDAFIIEIFKDREPCTEYYCPSIAPVKAYKYVLEVNSGFCEINGVKEGMSVTMHLARDR